MNAYVYRHIRLDTNMPFYVGIGVGYRANQKHKRSAYWNRIVNKHGYRIEIIMDGLTWEAACEKEKEFIALYGRRDKGLGTLCNLTDGGDGMLGYLMSEETKEKISKKKRGICPRPQGWKMTDEGRRKMSLAGKGQKRSLGRVLSEKTKKQISEKLMGNIPPNKISVVQYTLGGAFVAEHSSAHEAEKMFGTVNGANVTAACKGRDGRKISNGFMWKYKTDVLDKDGGVLMKIEPIKQRFTDAQKRRN